MLAVTSAAEHGAPHTGGGVSSPHVEAAPSLEELLPTPGVGQVCTVRLPWAPVAVSLVRQALLADLRARDFPQQTVDEAELVASELATNSIRHARPLPDGHLRVRWKVRPGVVEIEVTDGGGESVPRPAPPAVRAASGRGLRIVRSLAHEWGVVTDRSGVTVWAALGGPSRRRAH